MIHYALIYMKGFIANCISVLALYADQNLSMKNDIQGILPTIARKNTMFSLLLLTQVIAHTPLV